MELFVMEKTGEYRVADKCEVCSAALAHLSSSIKGANIDASSPNAVKDYLRLKLGRLEHEVFMIIYLDAQNTIIDDEEMFRGTVTQTSVYPREVVKACLNRNAVSVILAHNHPSGVVAPSRADEFLTQTLKSALALVDVRVLDHIVVGAGATCSFAEKGLL